MAKERSIEIQKHIDSLKLELAQQIGESRAAVLMQRTPKHEIRTRLLNPNKPEGSGNPRFRYVEHSWVTKMLNFAFAFNWDIVVEEIKEYSNEVVVYGYLEVRTKSTTIRKWGFGGAKIHSNSPNEKRADVFKSALSDMLKVCAARIGLGLDLYRTEDKRLQDIEEAPVESVGTDQPAPADPGDQESASQAQKDLVKQIAEKAGIEVPPNLETFTQGQVKQFVNGLKKGKK